MVAAQRIGALSDNDDAHHLSASEDGDSRWRTEDGGSRNGAASPDQRTGDDMSDEVGVDSDGSGSDFSDGDDAAWGPEMATPARGWRGASARRRLLTTAGRSRRAAMRRSGSAAEASAARDEAGAEPGGAAAERRIAAPELNVSLPANGDCGWVCRGSDDDAECNTRGHGGDCLDVTGWICYILVNECTSAGAS